MQLRKNYMDNTYDIFGLHEITSGYIFCLFILALLVCTVFLITFFLSPKRFSQFELHLMSYYLLELVFKSVQIEMHQSLSRFEGLWPIQSLQSENLRFSTS